MLPLVLVILSLFLSAGGDFRCLYYKGQCVNHCPRNMHPYHTRCDQDTMSQRTCSFRSVYPIGYTCGWSRCDCNADLLLDEEVWQCVKEEECLGSRRKGKRGKLRFIEERGGSEEVVSHIG